MTRLATLALAAAAGLAGSAAVAQPPAPPPAPPRPGVTWHGPATQPGAFPQRIERGFTVPPMFLAPQFGVGNWQVFGLPAPGPGQRWIRYYGDAYLVDGDGRVVDVRADLDWERAGEARARRDGDHGHGDRGHDHGDHHRHHGGEEHVRTYVYGAPGYPPVYGAPGYPPPPPGYYYGGEGGYHGGYYGGYGYGYGYAYPIIVETTVWGSGGYVEEVTEEVERVAAPRRVRRARPCVCRPAPRPRPVQRRPAPRPPAGERG